MKLLVTGGAGYVGSVVTRLLLDAGHQVVVLDDLSTGHAAAVPAGAHLVQGRVHDAAEVLTPDGRLRRACCTSPGSSPAGESMVQPELYWDNNIGRLAARCSTRCATRAYADWSSPPPRRPTATRPSCRITEAATTAPTNTYGATKLAVDMVITAEAAAHDLAAVSLRYFNVAGALIRPDGRRRRAARAGDPPDPDRAAGRRRASGRSCSSSATTTPPRTAPASATTSTSPTSPRHTCSR